jgi:hypothetical protein
LQVLPYLIDENLKKKSKQPKFVSKKLLGMDLMNEFASEQVLVLALF